MRPRHILLLLLAATMVLSSCIKDQLFNTSHPDTGLLHIVPKCYHIDTSLVDLSNLRYIAVDERGKTLNLENNHPLLSPGIYHFIGYTAVEGIKVSGVTAIVDTIVTLETKSSHPATKASIQEPQIDKIALPVMGRLKNIRVEADEEINIDLPLHPTIGQLGLHITFQGDAALQVASVKANLFGVAGSMNMLEEQYGSPSFVSVDVSHTGNTNWRGEVGLLGIVPKANQTLSLEVHFVDNYPPAVEIDCDLNAQLENFNLHKDEFLQLETNIILEYTGIGGMAAEITGWKVIDGGDMEAK